MSVFGKVFIVAVEMTSLVGPAAVLRASGSVRRSWHEPTGDPEIPAAEVRRETQLEVGAQVHPGDHVTLGRGSRLTLVLASGEVRDFIAPWDNDRALGFTDGA